MGLEGIVSKRLSAPYRSGPSRTEDREPGEPSDGETSGEVVTDRLELPM
jgi:hypothetical protein